MVFWPCYLKLWICQHYTFTAHIPVSQKYHWHCFFFFLSSVLSTKYVSVLPFALTPARGWWSISLYQHIAATHQFVRGSSGSQGQVLSSLRVHMACKVPVAQRATTRCSSEHLFQHAVEPVYLPPVVTGSICFFWNMADALPCLGSRELGKQHVALFLSLCPNTHTCS